MLTAIFDDLRRACGSLKRAPGFSLLAIAVLAVGIGASTAMFSAVHSVLLNSVPYPDAARLVALWDHAPDGTRMPVTFGTYREVQTRSRSFESIAVLRSWQPNLAGVDEPERLQGQRVSADYFRVLGVPPVLGPGFDPAADRPERQLQVIISHDLWHRRFGGDRAVVGRDVELDERSYTVVGVMPERFDNVLEPSANLWTLLQYDPTLPAQGREWGRHLRMVARLQSGVSPTDAGHELAQIGGLPIPEFVRPAHAPLDRGVVVNSLQGELTRAIQPALLAALAAVLLLLLTACVNVANLLLVRATQRSGEFEIRHALGAGRGHLLRQLLAENLVLAGFGGLLGLTVAELSLRALVLLAPSGLPRADAIGLDTAALLFTIAVATAVGVLIGLVPALRASGAGRRSAAHTAARRVIGSRPGLRHSLVVAEVAMAVVLLIGAGLLLRSLERLNSVDPGFEGSRLLTLQVHASGRRYTDDETTRGFFDEALAEVRSVPGIQSAALTSQLPLSGELDEYGVHFEPESGAISTVGHNALRYTVSPGYFATMAIPLLAGREFDDNDTTDAPLSAVISASFAQRRFASESPLGRRLRIGNPDGPWYTIIGVVGDVRQVSLATAPTDAIYVAHRQWHFADPAMSVVVRAHGELGALPTAVRAAIWAVDKDRPISRVVTMDELLTTSAAERRFASTLFSAFGLAALLLAAIGLYGVLAVSVAERRTEIGLRIALGARVASVLRWLLTQAMTVTAIGIGVGLVLAAATTRALHSLLFGVSATDPRTFTLAALLLAAIALLASLVPLRRALRVDPAQTLRGD